MVHEGANGWGTRLFLILIGLLLFGGLTLLAVKLFHEAASSTHAASSSR